MKDVLAWSAGLVVFFLLLFVGMTAARAGWMDSLFPQSAKHAEDPVRPHVANAVDEGDKLMPVSAAIDPRIAAYEALGQEAASLVPFVQAAQPARLKKFVAEHEADVAAWRFRCERWGDYLAVYVERRVGKTTDKVMRAIRLADASTVRFVPGHAPDMEGLGWFSVRQVLDHAHPHGGSLMLFFPNVDLPTRPTDQQSVIISSDDRVVGPQVDHIARDGAPDQIIFGDGGAQMYVANSYSSGMIGSWQIATTGTPALPPPGATIIVPFGLGQQVYDQILAAIRAGAPASVTLQAAAPRGD